MDSAEARRVLREAMVPLRAQSYATLKRLMDESESMEVTGESGTRYAIKLLAFWDDRPDGNLRVLGGIDDGGWRAFAPLCDDFIVAPDGSFVGEREGAEDEPATYPRSLPQLGLFAVGGGLAGLTLWCVLDWFLVKHPSPWTRATEPFAWMFPAALLAVALFRFRREPPARRIGLAVAGTVLACVATIVLILYPGIWFHLSIGGQL